MSDLMRIGGDRVEWVPFRENHPAASALPSVFYKNFIPGVFCRSMGAGGVGALPVTPRQTALWRLFSLAEGAHGGLPPVVGEEAKTVKAATNIKFL
ncbi:hypothetical protein [Endothiovibrio diazotrophicus]